MEPPPLRRVSHSTLPLLCILLLSATPPSFSLNITTLLASFPDLSAFATLLASTSVAADISHRSSITLLAVPNPLLHSSPTSSSDLTDVVRYHVLLQYLSPSDLAHIPPEGKMVTTLFQTTGRAPTNMGAVNITRDPITGNVTVKSPSLFSPSNATVISAVKTFPYNVSIFTISSLLVPSGPNLAASENRPPAPMNVTQVLIDGRDFNVAAAMLAGSGVAEEFDDDERGAGITVFVPTDEAFAGLPKTGERLQSLPADKKAVVLRFHVLHSYYPLGSLESIVNPVQPTLATEDKGAGRYTLNISRVNGSVAINTGVVQAEITRTVFDQNPVAVFAINKVLLPREIFGEETDKGVEAPPPEMGLAPEGVSGMESYPPARFSSPPRFVGGVESNGRLGKAFQISTKPNPNYENATPNKWNTQRVVTTPGGYWKENQTGSDCCLFTRGEFLPCHVSNTDG